MKRFLKVLLARRLAATPVGAALLALGWLLNRRRRKHQAHPVPAPRSSRSRRRSAGFSGRRPSHR
ncbi:DUF6203 family protein [Nonomuraea sp. LP-02]|uniref:DUF6203 family protein n=1 Tax=Nonomuraea sp. LP-02 TaxID=3097960 RepID=UPI002E37AA2F|nr:DUF6203 family protein [Nonomuraea sp. LP-02]MED7923525.1 DUF6203 family protein [Nonomuraea sp. LP-02]